MRVALIGASSNVGKVLIQRTKSDWNILSAGRSKESDIYLDLAEKGPLPSCLKRQQVDCVIHCSASFGADDWQGALTNEMVNSCGAIRAVQLASTLEAKHFVFLSSIFANPDEDNERFNSYGLSKLHGEQNIEHLCSMHDINFCILRVTQLYDRLWKGEKHQPFFYSILRKALLGEDICLYGKRNVTRNFMDVRDLVEIIEKVVSQKVCGRYNCVHPQSITISELAQLAIELSGNGGSVAFDTSQKDFKTCAYGSSDDLYSKINYIPRISIREGIASALKYASNL